MRLSFYEFSKSIRKDTALVDFLNDIGNLVNNGRYQLRVVSSVPTWTGEQGEHLLYISGTVVRFYIWDDTNSAWQFIEWNNSGLGHATLVGSVALTGQTAAIGTTTLYTPAASGVYRVSVYMVCTTTGTGTLSCTIAWSDDKQGQSSSPAGNIDLSVSGQASSGTLFIRSTATAITYATAIAGLAGSPQYAIFITLERLT